MLIRFIFYLYSTCNTVFDLAMQKPLSIAVCGCGSRARTYSKIAMALTGHYTLVAGADPNAERVQTLKTISANPEFQSFSSAEELLQQPQLADLMLIGTQDDYHFEPAKKALEKGYHLLLEKPAAQNIEQVRELAAVAKKHQRKIILCFVLRYTQFYSEVKKLVQSGKLGDIISMRAHEGVDPFHQAHSFVRGHWGRSADSTPMIIAKCSHDTDVITWLMDSPCKTVSSFGGTSYFNQAHAPEGATKRCTDGCPHVQTCLYSALRYTTDRERWLDMVYPNPDEERTSEKTIEWLKESKWGRCVYHCDNDVVDHQLVNMQFENGSTASLSMTAFDIGRTLEIYGTKASLRGGDGIKKQFGADLVIRDHYSEELEKIIFPELDNDGYAGHGGGDFGLMNELDKIIADDAADSCLIEHSIEGHLIGFTAEESRLQGGVPLSI